MERSEFEAKAGRAGRRKAWPSRSLRGDGGEEGMAGGQVLHENCSLVRSGALSASRAGQDARLKFKQVAHRTAEAGQRLAAVEGVIRQSNLFVWLAPIARPPKKGNKVHPKGCVRLCSEARGHNGCDRCSHIWRRERGARAGWQGVDSVPLTQNSRAALVKAE